MKNTLFTRVSHFILSPDFYRFYYGLATGWIVVGCVMAFFVDFDWVPVLYLGFGFLVVGGCSQYAQVHARKITRAIEDDGIFYPEWEMMSTEEKVKLIQEQIRKATEKDSQ